MSKKPSGKCQHKGCTRGGDRVTLFTTDKGTFCAEHFGPDQHATPQKPKRGKGK